MKIALAQVNPIIGDVIGNSERIIERIGQARAAGAELVVFTELSIVGYPPKDLLLKPRFVQSNTEALGRIAESCRGIAAIVGYVELNADAEGRRLRNAAAYLADGRVKGVRHKSLLPTYDVFDEQRYFEPGPEVAIIEHAGTPIGVSICEDLWNDEQLIGRRIYKLDPIGQLAAAGARIMINVSASPFTLDKHDFRMRLFSGQARKHHLPLVFVNQVGGNDELIFDGASAVFDADGNVIAQARAFDEDLLVVDVPCGPIPSQIGQVESAKADVTCRSPEGGAVITGTVSPATDATQRGAGVSPASVTGAVPVTPVGQVESATPDVTCRSPEGSAVTTGKPPITERSPEVNVITTGSAPSPGDKPQVSPALPSAPRLEPYPEKIASLYDALVLGTRDYVRKCGFKHVVLGLSGGIDSAVTAAIAAAALGPEAVTGVSMPSRYSSDHSRSDAEDLARNLGIEYRTIPIAEIHAAFETHLRPAFDGRPPDTTEENLQARIRANILMALSNKFGWLLLTTGNKSELAVGYTTLYGDMCGGLAVISDVPKTLIYPLARHINERSGRELIPHGSLTKPPSAELRPDQTDQDTLPPYETLDAILEEYVERERSVDEIIAAGFDADTVRKVTRWVDVNEYKRKQMPPGLKVTSRAFGFGRRMPIAARYRY